MARRLQLHEKFCTILGTRNVYFDPPESVKIKYPAIIYKIVNRNDIRADDRRYRGLVCYEAKFIGTDPDSAIPDTIMDSFTYCSHNQSYPFDNLHHDVFTIYY